MPFDSVEKARLDILELAGYLPQLRLAANGLCAPFWWYGDKGTGRQSILQNGTACALNTGERTVLVTADHVYRKYLEDRPKYLGFSCQLGSSTFEPEKYLIDRDAVLDLATFELPTVLLTASGVGIHHARTWPPASIRKGELLLYGGYPGNLRLESETNANFAFQSFRSEATAASESNITLHVDMPNVYWPGHKSEEFNLELGGISGGPVFRIVKEVIEYLELAGFIYEYSESLDVMFARQGTSVAGDGTIVRG